MKICLGIERCKVQSSPVAEPVEAKGEGEKGWKGEEETGWKGEEKTERRGE